MKDMRTVSNPFLESKARTLMYFALCAFRQAVTSSMTPAGGKAEVIHYLSGGSCPASLSYADQTGLEGPGNCPTVSGTTSTLTWNATTMVCVANPAIGMPTFQPPTKSSSTTYSCVKDGTMSPGIYSCGSGGGNPRALYVTKKTAVLTPGVYEIQHASGCQDPCFDAEIAANQTLTQVTFYLDPGATLAITGNGTTVTLSPYPGPVGTKNPDDGKFVIYADPVIPTPTSTNCAGKVPATENDLDIDNANATLTITKGTIYLPGGRVFEKSNGSLQDLAGQAIVNEWCVQTGNHPNPEISYSAGDIGLLGEILRLVT